MEKKEYTAPQLIVLGSVAELTKGSWTGLNVVPALFAAANDPDIFDS